MLGQEVLRALRLAELSQQHVALPQGSSQTRAVFKGHQCLGNILASPCRVRCCIGSCGVRWTSGPVVPQQGGPKPQTTANCCHSLPVCRACFASWWQCQQQQDCREAQQLKDDLGLTTAASKLQERGLVPDPHGLFTIQCPACRWAVILTAACEPQERGLLHDICGALMLLEAQPACRQ